MSPETCCLHRLSHCFDQRLDALRPITYHTAFPPTGVSCCLLLPIIWRVADDHSKAFCLLQFSGAFALLCDRVIHSFKSELWGVMVQGVGQQDLHPLGRQALIV